jgi:hypothetical protein
MDREALQLLAVAKSELLKASAQTQILVEQDPDVLAATVTVLRGQYKRAQTIKPGDSARVQKATRVRVKKPTR